MYCNVQACPVVVNRIFPAPPHAALDTVIVMLPDAEYMAKVLICPGTPGSKLAVVEVTVLKKLVVTLALMFAVSAKFSLLLLNGCSRLLTSLTVIVEPPVLVENSKL